jgi:HSP20 family protein
MTDARFPERYGSGQRAPSLRDAMQQLFDESVWDPFEAFSRLPTAGAFPRVDVSEDDGTVIVTANVPGVDSDNLDIEVDEDSVTLAGTIDRKEKDEGSDRQYFHYEREYGEFRRTIPLPTQVKSSEASAKTKNGVLTVTLPKAQESGKQKVTIESEN